MRYTKTSLIKFLFAALLILITVVPGVLAQDDEDMEGDGVQVVRGEVSYTVGFLESFNRGATSVALVNEANYVDDNFDDPIPTSWQVLGETTSDIYTSPFTYEVYLPEQPRGPLRDIDSDNEDDAGVALHSVTAYIDFLGKGYWETDFEYSAGFTSYDTTREFALRNEIVGGNVLIWAPDDNQSVPSGFGEDGVLLTEDDPTMDVPAGWSVLNMDEEPFTLDRSTEITIDLREQEQSLQPADYTGMTYSEAFQALVDQMRDEYAFTELKDVDFDALEEEFLPRFEEAEANGDPLAYQLALQEFAWSIPDGHVGAGLNNTIAPVFFEQTDGGLGMAIRELEDGSIITSFILDGGPADQAGIERGAEIVGINGGTLEERIQEVNIWSAPFSTPHTRRLQELRYAVRFTVGEEVTVTYRNPDSEEPQTVTMTAINERESWNYSSILRDAAPQDAPPIEFRVLDDSGYGYVRINGFSEYPELMFRKMEWIIDYLNNNGVPGVIIDMRYNSGGFNLDAQFAGYFFDERVVIGNSAQYYRDVEDFRVAPEREREIIPSQDGRYYGGEVALLVGPACASACESFSYNMTLNDRSTVVGYYPTAGLGGNITPVFMPDGVRFQFTTGRALDAEGDIRIEGKGIVPDVEVPVTQENLFADEDVVLQQAVQALDEATTTPTVDGGEISVGETVEGQLNQGERVQYTFTVPAEGMYDFVVGSDDPELDTVLNIYVAQNPEQVAASNDDAGDGTLLSALREVEVPAGLELIVEVAGFEDNAAGPFTLTISESGAAAEAPEATEEPAAEMTEEAEGSDG